MNVAHITNIFRASLCLWCKVEDFSFFRYVHRHSAVVAQPVLVFPDALNVTMAQQTELDFLIYNDPLGYADLILNGDPEEYLKNAAGSHGLED